MKLTDTQLVILPAASQRQDYCVELPPTSRATAHKVVSLQAPGRGAWKTSRQAMRCRSGASTTTKVRLRCESRRPVSARSRRPGTPVSWSPQVPRAPLHRVDLAASRSKRPRARLRQYPGDLCLRPLATSSAIDAEAPPEAGCSWRPGSVVERRSGRACRLIANHLLGEEV